MKRQILVGSICFALSASFLTACSSAPDAQTEQAAQQQEQSKKEAKETARKQSLDKVLANRSIVKYCEYPNDVYGEPLLLVQSTMSEPHGSFELTRFYSPNPETGEYELVKGLEVTTGVASGGFRGLSGIGSDGCFYVVTFTSGSGSTTIKKLVRVDGKYALETVGTGNIQGDEFTNLDIQSDRLQWVENTLGQKGQNGEVIAKGTIRYLDIEEMAKIQEITNPNPGTTGNGVVLLLDAPIVFNHDHEAHTSKMLSVSQDLKKYDGKEISIAFKENELLWPTDTSMPLGEPRVGEYRIVE